MFRSPHAVLKHLRRASFSAIVISALLLPASLSATEENPLRVVRNSNEAVLEIYRSVDTVGPETEERIFAIIDGVTDYETLADRATDRSCRDLTGEECRSFRALFIELLRVSAVKKLGRYRADSFEYIGVEETGEGAIVDTVAVFGEERISLVYHLAPSADGWRIVNYVVDDVDTVRNYRKQFMRLFGSETFEAVMRRLQDRIETYRSEGAE